MLPRKLIIRWNVPNLQTIFKDKDSTISTALIHSGWSNVMHGVGIWSFFGLVNNKMQSRQNTWSVTRIVINDRLHSYVCKQEMFTCIDVLHESRPIRSWVIYSSKIPPNIPNQIKIRVCRKSMRVVQLHNRCECHLSQNRHIWWWISLHVDFHACMGWTAASNSFWLSAVQFATTFKGSRI